MAADVIVGMDVVVVDEELTMEELTVMEPSMSNPTTSGARDKTPSPTSSRLGAVGVENLMNMWLMIEPGLNRKTTIEINEFGNIICSEGPI